MFNFYRCISWETTLKINEQTKIEKGLFVVMSPSSLYTCISSCQKSPTSSEQKSHNNLSSKITLLLLTDNSLKSFQFGWNQRTGNNWKYKRTYLSLLWFTYSIALASVFQNVSSCWYPRGFYDPKQCTIIKFRTRKYDFVFENRTPKPQAD